MLGTLYWQGEIRSLLGSVYLISRHGAISHHINTRQQQILQLHARKQFPEFTDYVHI